MCRGVSEAPPLPRAGEGAGGGGVAASRVSSGGSPDVLDLHNLPIDPTKLQACIDALGAIGTHPDGGLYRGVYDAGWVEAMALVRTWLEEARLTTRFDAVGNLWGRAEGSGGGPSVVSGSHVDTVRQGGK